MRYHIICSVLRPYVLPYEIIMEKATHNIIRKSELIQTVPIPEYRDISITITVCAREPIICVSSNPRFTGITCTEQGIQPYSVLYFNVICILH